MVGARDIGTVTGTLSFIIVGSPVDAIKINTRKRKRIIKNVYIRNHKVQNIPAFECTIAIIKVINKMEHSFISTLFFRYFLLSKLIYLKLYLKWRFNGDLKLFWGQHFKILNTTDFDALFVALLYPVLTKKVSQNNVTSKLRLV